MGSGGAGSSGSNAPLGLGVGVGVRNLDSWKLLWSRRWEKLTQAGKEYKQHLLCSDPQAPDLLEKVGRAISGPRRGHCVSAFCSLAACLLLGKVGAGDMPWGCQGQTSLATLHGV